MLSRDDAMMILADEAERQRKRAAYHKEYNQRADVKAKHKEYMRSYKERKAAELAEARAIVAAAQAEMLASVDLSK